MAMLRVAAAVAATTALAAAATPLNASTTSSTDGTCARQGDKCVCAGVDVTSLATCDPPDPRAPTTVEQPEHAHACHRLYIVRARQHCSASGRAARAYAAKGPRPMGTQSEFYKTGGFCSIIFI